MSWDQEPVAIVGSSCRFAGGITSPSDLWELLAAPPDLSKEVPPERFNIKGFYHPDGEYPGTTNSPKAYWLDQDHRVFDASFFSITPKEAEAIDPQQRMLLEVVYEALESSGYTLQRYSGESVSVYAGVMTADYDTLSQRDDLTASRYYATGNARSIIANRISYFFNFCGPSMTIDTACSSSLVALHQAVLGLRAGDASMACVAGVNLMMTPEHFIAESSLHMLSPTGHCRMWDANADGYARGEGVAAILLKSLSRALADGDHIQGIIRATGVNSDGRTKGVTMPNPAAQAALITATYARVGLDPKDPRDRCQYFEAHGTGTQVGDATEATAICEAFFGGTLDEAPDAKLYVGSVKTVVGHTEGAAGLAGILKVMQAMQQQAIPPNLHLDRLNPNVKASSAHLQVPTALMSWPTVAAGQPLRASVNSFGFGGTNAHAIVERYDPAIHNVLVGLPPVGKRSHGAPCTPSSPIQGEVSVQIPLLLSANSQTSLSQLAAAYKDYLERHDSTAVEEVAWYLATHRSSFPYRIAVSGGSRSELIQSLEHYSRCDKPCSKGGLGGRNQSMSEKRGILGVFTGQGAQWPTMSARLLQSSRIYRQSIQGLDTILQSCPDPPSWTLQKELEAEAPMSRVNIASVSQPLCTAVQIALVDLLRTVGVTFTCVIGHSSGEIAAAYAAGRLTARDAILIAYYRGKHAHLAVGQAGEKGGMIAVALSVTDAAELCNREEFRGKISIAASNAYSSVTLSGDRDAVQQVHRLLTKKGTFVRPLIVDTAYHSYHMEKAVAAYIGSLDACNITPLPQGNGVFWISTVSKTGDAPNCDDLRASYWADNMVHTVLFREALERTISEFGLECAVEVGPHAALAGPATQIAKALLPRILPYSGVLDRRKDDRVAFSEFLGFMWAHHGPSSINIRRFVETSSCPGLANAWLEGMPSYPWDHTQLHHRESRISRQYHFRTHPPHELLGVRTRDDTEFELRWRNVLRLDKVPWIEHHKFQGQALLPASAYCIMALDAARIALNGRSASVIELQDLEFMSGITFEANSPGVETLFTLAIPTSARGSQESRSIEASFTLASCPADSHLPMRKNFTGGLRMILDEPYTDVFPGRKDHAETLPVSPSAFYRMMAGSGLEYTGPFKSLVSIDRRYNFSTATLKKKHPDDTTSLAVSPAMLDSCLQSCFMTFSSPGDKYVSNPWSFRSLF